ncbi:MAG: Crp/Fnr family transcriptional regulator [Spirochaetales bacterium]|nr:Crp/Fnr family transcriptional regulator [Spirochaetales bacterium]
MNKLMHELPQAKVFNKLTATDHAELIQLSEVKTYHKGEFICWQDEIWSKALYIVFGKIEWIMLSPGGKRQIVFGLEKGDVVWGHSIFDGKPMPASLEVMEECKVYLWSGKVIMPIVSRNVEAVWDVSRLLIQTMRNVREIIYGFAFHPVSGRLARLLLNHYHPVEGQFAPRDLTLDEMAAMVGTTRELVCKVLYRFADAEVIQIKRTEFVFTNREKLEALAGEV